MFTVWLAPRYSGRYSFLDSVQEHAQIAKRKNYKEKAVKNAIHENIPLE
jgi:hypothetical protein